VGGWELVRTVTRIDEQQMHGGAFEIACPTGKRAFSGGADVGLYNPSGEVWGIGNAPIQSSPNYDGTKWTVVINQPHQGQAGVEVRLFAICAFTSSASW
jgi:hypothetical protein